MLCNLVQLVEKGSTAQTWFKPFTELVELLSLDVENLTAILKRKNRVLVLSLKRPASFTSPQHQNKTLNLLFKADLCFLERFVTDRNHAEKHLQCTEEKKKKKYKNLSREQLFAKFLKHLLINSPLTLDEIKIIKQIF